MSETSPSIIIVTGPTASGKSRLALQLAREFCGEIVNADSVQVYRGFDIGSAKSTSAEQSEIPHHLLSIKNPEEIFSAGEFVRLSERAITEIASRGRVPIVSGGTGLYIRSLVQGLAPITVDETASVTFESSLSELSLEDAQRERYRVLTELDPLSAGRLAPGDTSRVSRALRVALGGGGSIAAHHDAHQLGESRYRALVILLLPKDREELYQMINRRVLQMIEDGFEQECRDLLRSVPPQSPPFRAIGYREMVRMINGGASLEETISNIQQSTRNFAKRQYTWWRNQPERLHWPIIKDEEQTEFQTLLEDINSFLVDSPPTLIPGSRVGIFRLGGAV